MAGSTRGLTSDHWMCGGPIYLDASRVSPRQRKGGSISALATHRMSLRVVNQRHGNFAFISFSIQVRRVHNEFRFLAETQTWLMFVG